MSLEENAVAEPKLGQDSFRTFLTSLDLALWLLREFIWHRNGRLAGKERSVSLVIDVEQQRKCRSVFGRSLERRESQRHVDVARDAR